MNVFYFPELRSVLPSDPTQTQHLNHPHWSQPRQSSVFEKLRILRSHALYCISFYVCIGNRGERGKASANEITLTQSVTGAGLQHVSVQLREVLIL